MPYPLAPRLAGDRTCEWFSLESDGMLGNCFVPFSDESCTYRKEGNVLFNNALNSFYLRLYGIRHMVKDHSDRERGNLLLPHGLLFYMHHPTDRIAYTTAFVHQSWNTGWTNAPTD